MRRMFAACPVIVARVQSLVRFRALPLLGSLVLALAGALPVRAQEKEPVLPDLAPREVEIRGRLEISFPSLRRQPLVGFNPPPRVPDVRGRHPYVAPYKQRTEDLPPSPLQRPAPPAVAGRSEAPPLNGEFEAGTGRYLSRVVRADLGIPLGPRSTFGLDLDYRGSDGNAPFPTTPDLKNRFDALSFDAGIEHRTRRFRTGVNLEGFFENYTLFGTEAILRSDLRPHPDRQGEGIGLTGTLESGPGESYQYTARLRYGASRYRTDIFRAADRDDAPFRRLERRLDFDASGAVDAGKGRLSLDLHLTTSGLDTEGLLGRTVRAFNLGPGYRFAYNRFQVLARARFMGFEAVGQNGSGGTRRLGYFSPEVRIDTYPGPEVHLYARNSPGLSASRLDDLYRENPYLVDEPLLQPTLRTIDARVGGEYFQGPFKMNAYVGYQFAPNQRYFTAAEAPINRIYTRGFTQVAYDRARVLLAGADASVLLTRGMLLSAGFTLRDGRLTRLDTDIPYFATVVARSMLSVSFDGRKGLFQVQGRFENARDIDPLQSARVPAFVDVDALLSYYFTPWVGATLRLDNIGNRTERWLHYPHSSNVLMGSLNIRW